LAGAKITVRLRRTLPEDAGVQADLGRAEALLRSGRAFLYEAPGEAWQVDIEGGTLSVAERAMLRLAATQSTSATTQAVDLMLSAGMAGQAFLGFDMGITPVDAHGRPRRG
jgi:indole-3-acetate monooxygenase